MKSALDVTGLLAAWQEGDQNAGNILADSIYPELKKLARLSRRRSPHMTLQTTEIVNEAYERLVGQQTGWQDRSHFYAIAATTMRRVVMDHLRSTQRQKRGGAEIIVSLEDIAIGDDAPPVVDWLSLDQALSSLQDADAQLARLVELRIFAGLSIEESAKALGVGRATAVRRWRFARAWLREHFRNEAPNA